MNVTGRFGGLLADPFDTPESQTGTMWYVGARHGFNDDSAMVGLESNRGSQDWFNLTPAEDDILVPKTAAHGSVLGAYRIHQIDNCFLVRLGYQDYSCDYSGSGRHVGTPEKLDEMPVLDFSTHDCAEIHSLSMTARF